jgi:hypothetical protein
MTVRTRTTERAEVEIPHEIFVKFLRSFGADIPEDAKLHVYQPSLGSPQGVHVSWELGITESERDIALMDDEDINAVAGLHDDGPF